MTDKELKDLCSRVFNRLKNKFDHEGAIKLYCRYLTSDYKSFRSYIKGNAPDDLYGFKNIASLAGHGKSLYESIKAYLGKDFYDEIETAPEKTENRDDDSRLDDINEQLVALTNVCSALLSAFKEAWRV